MHLHDVCWNLKCYQHVTALCRRPTLNSSTTAEAEGAWAMRELNASAVDFGSWAKPGGSLGMGKTGKAAPALQLHLDHSVRSENIFLLQSCRFSRHSQQFLSSGRLHQISIESIDQSAAWHFPFSSTATRSHTPRIHTHNERHLQSSIAATKRKEQRSYSLALALPWNLTFHSVLP